MEEEKEEEEEEEDGGCWRGVCWKEVTICVFVVW